MSIRSEATSLHQLCNFRGTLRMKRGTRILYSVHLQHPTNPGIPNLALDVFNSFSNGQMPFIHFLFNALVSICGHKALSILHKLVIFVYSVKQHSKYSVTRQERVAKQGS